MYPRFAAEFTINELKEWNEKEKLLHIIEIIKILHFLHYNSSH